MGLLSWSLRRQEQIALRKSREMGEHWKVGGRKRCPYLSYFVRVELITTPIGGFVKYHRLIGIHSMSIVFHVCFPQICSTIDFLLIVKLDNGTLLTRPLFQLGLLLIKNIITGVCLRTIGILFSHLIRFFFLLPWNIYASSLNIRRYKVRSGHKGPFPYRNTD